MPRRKQPATFKYTTRKNGVLFVRYPIPNLKHPVWRKVTVETQDEVNRIIGDLKNDYVRRVTDSALPTRCDKFFAFWLDLIKNRVSERTLQNRESVIRLYLKPALDYFDLSEARPVQFEMIYSKMIQNNLHPQTVRKVHAVASSIFKEAVNLDLIKSNPVTRTRPPKIHATDKVKVMSLPEVKRFLAECSKSPVGIIFEFALETGMRPQEYLALRWSDVDLKKRVASVTRALVYDRKGGGYYFKEPKTKKSRRTIPLSKQMCEKLLEHQTIQKRYIQTIHERIRRRAKPSREHRKEINKQWLENHRRLDLVFPSKEFTPWKDVNLGKRHFKPLAEAAGLDASLTTYSLRHSSISLLLASGVNIKVIAERAGHSSTSFTMDTYVHLIGNQIEAATDKLASVLYD